jgi:hypothetical protein
VTNEDRTDVWGKLPSMSVILDSLRGGLTKCA